MHRNWLLSSLGAISRAEQGLPLGSELDCNQLGEHYSIHISYLTASYVPVKTKCMKYRTGTLHNKEHAVWIKRSIRLLASSALIN